jgi:hypothetical protein
LNNVEKAREFEAAAHPAELPDLGCELMLVLDPGALGGRR